MNENNNTIKLYLIKVQKHGFNTGIAAGSISVDDLDKTGLVNTEISKIFNILANEAYEDTKTEFGGHDPDSQIKKFNTKMENVTKYNQKFLREATSAQRLLRALRKAGKNQANLKEAIKRQSYTISSLNRNYEFISENRKASNTMVESLVKVANGEEVTPEMANKLGSGGGLTSFQGDLFEAMVSKYVNPKALIDPELLKESLIGANNNGISDAFTKWSQNGHSINIGLSVKTYLSGAKEYKVGDSFPFTSLQQFASSYSTLLKLNYYLKTTRKKKDSEDWHTVRKSNISALIGAITADYAFRRGGSDWSLYSINLTAKNKGSKNESVQADAEFFYKKYRKYAKIVDPVRAKVVFNNTKLSPETHASKELSASKYTIYAKFKN